MVINSNPLTQVNSPVRKESKLESFLKYREELKKHGGEIPKEPLPEIKSKRDFMKRLESRMEVAGMGPSEMSVVSPGTIRKPTQTDITALIKSRPPPP